MTVTCLLAVSCSLLANDGPNILSEKVYSKILDEQRTISVFLPDGYEKDRKTYPVLYVLDAEGETVFSEAVLTVQDRVKRDLMPEVIVVGIWNVARNRDMIPVAVSHRPGSGGSSNFLAFIIQELKPYIQLKYPASERALLYGMSNSALFAVYALLENPETFDGVIASSPMIGHCPEFMMGRAEKFARRESVKSLVLFMIYGSEDSRRVTDYVPDFQKYLTANAPEGFASVMEILEGEGHVPRSSLAKGLAHIFGRSRGL